MQLNSVAAINAAIVAAAYAVAVAVPAAVVDVDAVLH